MNDLEKAGKTISIVAASCSILIALLVIVLIVMVYPESLKKPVFISDTNATLQFIVIWIVFTAFLLFGLLLSLMNGRKSIVLGLISSFVVLGVNLVVCIPTVFLSPFSPFSFCTLYLQFSSISFITGCMLRLFGNLKTNNER